VKWKLQKATIDFALSTVKKKTFGEPSIDLPE